MSLQLSTQELYIIQGASIVWSALQLYDLVEELFERRGDNQDNHQDCPNCGGGLERLEIASEGGSEAHTGNQH